MSNYLYNGVELPELPEWNKERFPYALISSTFIGYRLYCFEKPLSYYETGNNIYVGIGGCKMLSYHINNKGGSYNETEWTFEQEKDSDYIVDTIWVNADIYLIDGTLYLAASDPVPVLALTERDLYRKINGQPAKLTLYKKVGGKLVKVDEYNT